MKTLLQNSTLVTMNSKKDILENCDLLLDDDKIGRILPQGSRHRVAADKVLNCKGKIIIPGLVSAHSHLMGIFQRGLWSESSFGGWMSKSSAMEAMVDLSPEDIYVLHCAACIEFLRHGVTTALNMLTVSPSLDLKKIEAASRAFKDTGIRGVMAVMLRDRMTGDERIVGQVEDGSWISIVREAAKRVNNLGSATTFMLAPSSPQRCSDQLLVSCRELADELKVGIHIHLAETKTHVEDGQRLYGEPMVMHLEKVGFLSGRLSVAHANWLEDDEIDVLKKHEVKVVHNPSSNMKLGSGFARVKKMLQKGLTIGLGADSPNSGTVYSIFEQMKLSVLAPRILWAAENWVQPKEAFEMGTVGGAKALLLDEDVGSVEEGKKADLVILNPKISLLPMNDLMSQLVLCENGESVESVFVDGKPVLLEGHVETIQEKDVLARLSTLTPRIQKAQREVSRTHVG